MNCPLGESRFCRRFSCKPEPWIYYGENIMCEACGKEMCRGEEWNLEEVIGKEVMLCNRCRDRLYELEDSVIVREGNRIYGLMISIQRNYKQYTME